MPVRRFIFITWEIILQCAVCYFEIQKDDKNSYFSCDNPKGAVPPGNETIVSFKFKPPAMDPLIVKEINNLLRGIF